MKNAWRMIGMIACSAVVAARAADDRPPVVVSDKALQVHRASFVFDGHNDLPWELREKAGGRLDSVDLLKGLPKLHTDIPRLRAGNVGAQFWAAYVPASTMRDRKALAMTL